MATVTVLDVIGKRILGARRVENQTKRKMHFTSVDAYLYKIFPKNTFLNEYI